MSIAAHEHQFLGQSRTAGPGFPWMRTWLLVLLISGIALGSEEAFWRSRGHRADVSDSRDLWHFWRQRVHGENIVVLLGTSRMLGAFSPVVLDERCPRYSSVQLAVAGNRSPIGTLLHLSADESFSGIVICSLLPPMLAPSVWTSQNDHYLYHPRALDYCDKVVKSWLQSCSTLLSARLRLRRLTTKALESTDIHIAPPTHSASRFDRTIEFDYYGSSLDARRRTQLQMSERIYRDVELCTPSELRSVTSTLNHAIDRIRQRGGDVVFVRLPSSGNRLALENKYHPREVCWAPFATGSNATCIHFEDLPSAAAFNCPDESHLDWRSARRFTRMLLDELMSRDILEARAANGNRTARDVF